MTPSSRRMRRSREAAASNDEVLSGFDLYNIQGDSVGALDLFTKSTAPSKDCSSTTSSSSSSSVQSKSTMANEYNCMLLSRLSPDAQADGCAEMLKKMNEIETEFQKKSQEQTLSPRKRKRRELIFAYNRALVLLTKGECKETAQICLEKIKDSIETKLKPPDELAEVSSRMAFLLLECILALSVGRSPITTNNLAGLPSPYEILDWLEVFDTERDHQLKFLLSLYRSRVDLADLDHEDGKCSDNKIRSARKELKQAMEVFQHKLRPTFGAETGSVVSSANSEENASTSTTPHHEQQPPPSSVVLQKLNQSALSLKAHSEQLKGNTKKSLILCSEALAAASVDASYQAVHDNNLSVVYETNGKRHLALHALAKGLRAKNSNNGYFFYPDGTARPDQTLLLLHNSAICALQARHYLSAYECMATCIARSDVFRSRPRCWLRMAEACIGLFSELKRKNNGTKFSLVQVNGEPKGIVVDNALFTDHPEITDEELSPVLASAEDLEQVQRNPLVRARATLEYSMKDANEMDDEELSSARLALAYVHLAFREYELALKMIKLVLEAPEPAETEDGVKRRAHHRRFATARMYAAEAYCALGDSVKAMKFIVGDAKDDAFDRLASDLSGVTIETAATNGKGKRRLARAQTVVRSSASAVMASMGNLTAAKQLAMSAQAMEDAYVSNRERSSARRALIYTLLRQGQHGPALSLLRSLR